MASPPALEMRPPRAVVGGGKSEVEEEQVAT